MPISGYIHTCVPSVATPDGLCITMPGGVSICATVPSPVPIPKTHLVASLFAQLNTALAPTQPVFTVIEAVVTVFDVIKAVATLNPVKIAEAMPALTGAVEALIKLIPQISLPLMIRDFVVAMIQYLDGLIQDIITMIDYQTRISLAAVRASRFGVNLDVVIACANNNLTIELAHKEQQMAPISQLMGLINAFLRLLGLPCIPSFSSINLSPGFLEFLRELSTFLSYIVSVIVIPIPHIPQASGDC